MEEEDSNREDSKNKQKQVTFSKRHISIFKKGSELCTLCDVDIVMGVFSLTGKPFTFSHPWFEHVFKRYFNNVNNIDVAIVLSPQEEQQVQQLQQHNEQHQKREEEMLKQLEIELKMKRLRIQNNVILDSNTSLDSRQQRSASFVVPCVQSHGATDGAAYWREEKARRRLAPCVQMARRYDEAVLLPLAIWHRGMPYPAPFLKNFCSFLLPAKFGRT
ncbi:hypothetical protein Sjap_012884 [Stephania japonica]|uniref:MADS-box domain-containing protein n=1 Tax=Stephania japonica TaxID=461633 RepID=A0AAP0IWR1_9MAGN